MDRTETILWLISLIDFYLWEEEDDELNEPDETGAREDDGENEAEHRR
jgi:hypothetical protein